MPENLTAGVGAPVQLGERTFFVDYDRYRRGFLKSQRDSVDSSPTPGESSLNPEGSIPRSQTDWSLGGGQEVFDDDEADPRMYYTGRNVQAVRRGRIQLSNKLQVMSTTRGQGTWFSAWTERTLVQTGNSLFWIEFSSPNYTLYRQSITAGPYGGAVSPATAIAASATAMLVIATDGTNTTWVSRAGSGVSRATTETGAFTAAWSAVPTNVVAYCNGHLLGIAGNSLWEFDSGGAKLGGVDIIAHPNTSWVWQGAVAGAGRIYVWGNAGSESAVYVISDVLTGGTLAPPKIALPMPPGETISHLEPIGGYFLARTNMGCRVITPNGDTLESGPLIVHREFATDVPNLPVCASATTEGAIVAWRNPSVQPDFLSRIDFSRFAGDAPAHHLIEYTPPDATPANNGIGAIKVIHRTDTVFASNDLWVSGGTTSASTRRLWAVTLNQAPNTMPTLREKANSGTFYTGWLTYGTTEPKQPLTVRIIHDTIPAGSDLEVSLILPSGSATALTVPGPTGESSDVEIDTTAIAPGREFQLLFTITRATTNTNTPSIRSWTFRGKILPVARQEEIILPIRLYSTVLADNGREVRLSVADDFRYLQGLVGGPPVTLLEGGDGLDSGVATEVFVDDVRLYDGEASMVSGMSKRPDKFYEGIYFVRCLSAV